MIPSATPNGLANIAVVIAAFNAETTVDLAVRSALAESETLEVWVIDDASTDATARVAESCDDGSGRLRVIRQAANGGPSAARNVALAATRAEWICVLDADDGFAPGRLGRLLAEADGAEMVADAITRVSAFDGTATFHPQDTPQAASLWATVSLADFIEGNVSRRGRHREELGFIKPLMSTVFLRRHRIEYAPRLRLGEDFLLYAQVLAHGGRLRLGPPCGYIALTRPDSLSGRHTIDDLEALRDCTRNLEGIRTLTAPERRAVRRHWRSVDDRLQWRRLIEAVKARDARAALKTFHDPASALNLLKNLAGQAWLRGPGRVGRRAGSGL
ncbi:glycosyltransferase family 2 protein [Brevundimonas sp. PWP3-1b1]|uniref:glycosyltransferase family 2 protein n=1 Tax=unclassified Brevundimonas TaxID=2622653 RepID=UPI003CEA9AD1